MPVLTVTCLTTGRSFPTGIEVDKPTFKTLPNVMTRSRCLHCGREHTWWTREARLVDVIPPSQWAEMFKRR